MSARSERHRALSSLSVRESLRSIRRSPIRSALTVLGVVIGVASVVAMVSIGSGASAQVRDTISRLSGNIVTLSARTKPEAQGAELGHVLTQGEGLTIMDYLALRERVGSVRAQAPSVVGSPTVATIGNRSTEIQPVGTDVDGLVLMNRKILSGAFFGRADVATAASVCVLSKSVAAKLFKTERVTGNTIRIGQAPLVVIGVVTDEEQPDIFGGPSEDKGIFVPYTSMLLRMSRAARIVINIKANSTLDVAGVKARALSVLESNRGPRTAVFSAFTAEDSIQVITESTRTMTALLAAIGSISLIVGGIGIMNIMLVSVKERTREIGIRTALGTRSQTIALQFLLEAAVLSTIGGMIGVVLGVLAGISVAHWNAWPVAVTWQSIVSALICSACVGLFFGYHPAHRASALNPIDALRYDY